MQWLLPGYRCPKCRGSLVYRPRGGAERRPIPEVACLMCGTLWWWVGRWVPERPRLLLPPPRPHRSGVGYTP